MIDVIIQFIQFYINVTSYDLHTCMQKGKYHCRLYVHALAYVLLKGIGNLFLL